MPERSSEVIELCKALIEGTRQDDVKYDAYRILAEAYKSINEYSLAKAAIENIPEIYFTKLGAAAELLDGEDMFRPAVLQKWLSLGDTIQMYERLAAYYEKQGEADKAVIQLEIARNLIHAVKGDLTTQFHTCSLYEAHSERLTQIEEAIKRLNA